jgi:hypothetical protein
MALSSSLTGGGSSLKRSGGILLSIMDFPVPAGETRMRMTISGQPGSCGKSGGGELNLKEKISRGMVFPYTAGTR